ncbi:MAG TPA: hypothetical protein VJ826_09370, partial [Candidatus Polarisedimenticolaceae bacterium]|nr:hypothetical protein [Candidatus Polarisedimenticolaceae bacterium]
MTRTLGLGLFVVVLSGQALAARPPTAEEAPHGIANQAADPSARAAADTDRGPVAVPEPSEKARRYARGGNVLWVVYVLWDLVVPALVLFTGLSGRLRDAARAVGRTRFGTIVVYVVLYILLMSIVGFPLSYYAGFTRPHAYGLSNQALSKFLGDEAKALGISFVAGALLAWLLYALIRKSPERWWLWCGLLSIPIGAFV